MIPIKVNISEFVEEFNISKKDVDDLKEEILSGLINSLYYNWQTVVKNSSLNPGTKEKYAATLGIFREGKFKGGVGLTQGQHIWLINAIESGIAAFDMKEGMLKSKKAKTGKSGQKYITIPFRIGTPRSNFQVTMSNPTYQIARTLQGKQQVRQGQLKGSDAEIRTRPMIKTQTKIFDEYKHKSSIFAGIQRGTGANQGQYHTMRRISNAPQPNGSSPESWIHKGIIAHKLSDIAIDKMGVNDLVESIIKDFQNQKL
jgi:hypothetical protein